jgi:anti-anti-sigma regulatory factor
MAENRPVIRLTKHQSLGNGVVIRIEGSLSGETVGELRDLIASEVRAGILDLSGLASLDAEGRALLLELRAHGHRLRGGSLYIKRLLEEAQP